MGKRHAPSHPMETWGYSKEFGEMKEKVKNQAVEWAKEFYSKEGIAARGGKGIQKGDAMRAIQTLTLSDDALWADLTEDFLTNPETFEKGIQSFLATISGRQQGIGNMHKVLPFDELHHGQNLQTHGKAAQLQTPKTLREFLTLSAEKGIYYGDSFKNLEGKSYDIRSHRGSRGNKKSVNNPVLTEGEDPSKIYHAHTGGTGQAGMPNKVYGSGQEMLDAATPSILQNQSDELLGKAADLTRQGPVNEALQNDGIVPPGFDVFKPGNDPETMAKARQYLANATDVQRQAAAAFRTPNPNMGAIANALKIGGALTVMGVLGDAVQAADSTGKLAQGQVTGQNVMGAAAGYLGLGSLFNPLLAIPAAVAGVTHMAGERREDQIATKEYDKDYTKSTPGATSHIEGENEVTITATEAPTMTYNLPPHAGVPNPYLNHFKAP